ncbi:MAG: bifunctional pyr operon transcriptional regulator/uracil phosphoribosyltransferase PyrR [Betaproteobacteria bacterium]|nr:bifunctional pyr operon transcriptional regulator/uracil phosphoribosyltransferase PyrR [Betaproteobacteria bacterium]
MQLDANPLITILADQLRDLPDNTAIIGIHTGGVWVAERLRQALGSRHRLGALAVTLHRDDYGSIGLHPQKKATDLPFAVDGQHILLVDDVIRSGRTLRAALNELFDFGRPASVKLACLVDRGGRELPFSADYIGVALSLNNEDDLVLKNEQQQLRFEIEEKRMLP